MINNETRQSSSKFALGTAQFGLPYGIANTAGQIPHKEAKNILAVARANGIHTLDTAVAYGDSELTLGEAGVNDWQIITKLPQIPENETEVSEWLESSVSGSLNRLRVPTLHGLLLHRPSQLLEEKGADLYKALLAQKEKGRVRKIGISVYGPDELDVLPSWMKFDIVQVPMSLLDNRISLSGWAERLGASGTELHARSIFLQGFLLMPSTVRPLGFQRWERLWTIWDEWLKDNNLSPLQACVRYALYSQADKLVIGVDNADQLQAILKAGSGDLPALPKELFTTDPELLNPALWKNR